jgi:hypothetical protein
MEEKKRCPYCGEEILAVAKKCKYCGQWLNTQQEQHRSEQSVPERMGSENSTHEIRKETKKNHKWLILIVVLIVLAVLSPFVYNAIDQAILDAKYDNTEKQYKKEIANKIKDDNAFLKQAAGNMLFMDTPVGGNIGDFINYLKKKHSEIFSTSPSTSRDGNQMKATWIGSYHGIDNCIYTVIADNNANNNVLCINIRVEDFESNENSIKSIIIDQNESFGEPYTRKIEGYKESARWILPNGLIDWDIYYNTDEPNKLNIQISGNEWKKKILELDPIE